METWGWSILFGLLVAMPAGLPIAGILSRDSDTVLQRAGKLIVGLVFGFAIVAGAAFTVGNGHTITIPLPW